MRQKLTVRWRPVDEAARAALAPVVGAVHRPKRHAFEKRAVLPDD